MNPSNGTPTPLLPLRGPHLTAEQIALFMPWGTAKAIMADSSFGVVVQFEEGFQLTFIPVAGPEPIGFDITRIIFGNT